MFAHGAQRKHQEESAVFEAVPSRAQAQMPYTAAHDLR